MFGQIVEGFTGDDGGIDVGDQKILAAALPRLHDHIARGVAQGVRQRATRRTAVEPLEHHIAGNALLEPVDGDNLCAGGDQRIARMGACEFRKIGARRVCEQGGDVLHGRIYGGPGTATQARVRDRLCRIEKDRANVSVRLSN